METENSSTRLNIVLHENQRIIDSSPASYKVIKAGKRFGKTKWATYALVRAAGDNANSVYWYVCPTYRMAKSIAWWELNWILPKEFVKRSIETDLTKELVNGSRIQLIGADNEDSLRGPRLDGMIMDEAAYIDEYVWPGILRGQLLGAQDRKKGFAYFISSPNRKGRNWFTGFHAEAKSQELSGNKDWAAFYFTIFDNPTLNKDEVEKMRDATPDDTWDLEYLAKESSHAGQLYSEFKYPESLEAKEYDKNLLLVRAIDWGIAHPTVCLFIGIDLKARKIFVLDEFVKSGFTIQESCDWITKITAGRPVEWTVIDPSTSKRNSQTGRTDKDEFLRNGIGCIPGDNRDRGYDIVRMFLKRGMLKVHPKCKTLIHEFRNLQWGDKVGNDAADSVRYAMVRIHDLFFSNSIYDADGKPAAVARPANVYNLNDPIFKKAPDSGGKMSWAYDEAMSGS